MVRRPWGSSYSEDPDYEPLEDHDDELPPSPPLRRQAVVKKRTFVAATQKSRGPSEPASSTYHGEENVASDPLIDKEDINVHNVLKNGSETKSLPPTFQHTYGQDNNMEAQHLKDDTKSIPSSAQVPQTINGHLDMPLQDGADYKLYDQKDLRRFGPASMSDVENGAGNIHPTGSSLEQILQAIMDRHDDISKESYFKSNFVIATMLEGICGVIQDLEGKKLDQLDISALLEYDLFLEDADKMNFNVKWLRRQLAELLEAVKSFAEAKEATHEKSELMEEIENMKKDIQERKADVERLISLVQEQERELALRTLQGDMLSTKITVLKTRYQSLLSKPLTIDRLL